MNINYYEILGIHKDSNEKVINIAYRELVKKYENSNNPDDLEKLKEIDKAYLVLINAEKRAEYNKNGFVIEKNDKDKKNEPPKKKWQNFWYYFKWHTIASTFFIIVLIITIRSCATKINPDLKILFLSSTYISEADINIFQKNISLYVDDYTTNNKVETEINNLPIGGDANNQMTMAYNQKFVAEVSLGEIIFYMCDEKSSAKFLDNNMLSDISNISKNEIAYDGKLIKLSNAKIFEGLSNQFPKELYIGIRLYNEKDLEKDKAKKLKYDRVMEIIKKMQ